MIIDAHQHFWQFDLDRHSWLSGEMKRLRRDFMPTNLKPLLDKNEVNGCVAVQADQTERETQFLLQLADRYDFIKGVVGWLDLQADNLGEKLNWYHQNKYFKGVRHLVQDEPDDDFLLRPDFLRGINMLQTFDLCYDILIFARHLPVAIKFASKFPDQKFVLDHIAKPEIKNQKIAVWEEGVRELADHPKMYCKLSGMVTEADWKNWKAGDLYPYLDVVFDAFGPDRLMFGSDWPMCTLASSYAEVLKIVKEYIQSYDPSEQQKILGSNAQQFYNL